MTDHELIRRIARQPGLRAGYKQLVRELGLGGGRGRRLLLEQLSRLTAAGKLAKAGPDQWVIPSAIERRQDLIAGKLDLHRDGYGFVRRADRATLGSDDIFIPPDGMNSAMQGDQVLVAPDAPRADGRQSGRIVRVLTRANPTVVGTFRLWMGRELQQWPGAWVIPFDSRMTEPILIPPGYETAAQDLRQHRTLGSVAAHLVDQEMHTDASGKAPRLKPEELDGMVVDVEIVEFPTATKPARGRILEVLGNPEDFGVDVEITIRKHHLPHAFPPEVIEDAAKVAQVDPETVASRRDFRSLPIVTIDGETAKDFDDAILVEKRDDGGYLLQVHIADVAEYVRPATALDLEARLRGTSVYFPDRAIPMLPHELSSGVCSLLPNEDRLVLSCLMQINEHGHIESFEVTEGVIRSFARMTYTAVQAVLDGDEDAYSGYGITEETSPAQKDQLRQHYAALKPRFLLMQELAHKLNHVRELRGSIDFDLPEAVIEFDQQGQMTGIVRSQRGWSNRLIEEFMLAANQCVATWLEDLQVPSLYRIHEKPEPRRVVDFEDTAVAFGYSLGLGALPVKRFQFRADKRDHQRRGERGQRGLSKPPGRGYELPQDMPVTPQMYQKLTHRIAGKPEERILSHLMLRSLRQARYSERNEGHFALAAPSYSHFTSPIRRYPDLIVHRIAKALLQAGVHGQRSVSRDRMNSPWKELYPSHGKPFDEHEHRHSRAALPSYSGEPPVPQDELAQIAEETSQAERRAAEAERELLEWKKIRFMRDRVGENFQAMVLNATRYGLFVELDELFIEGLVPIECLTGDRYSYQENSRQVIGNHSGIAFSAGDRVEVVLDRVLVQEHKLQFSLLNQPQTGRVRPSGKTKTKSNKAKKAEKKARHQARATTKPKGFRPPKSAVKKKKPKR